MNENLNLEKILDGCPVGTVFYNSIYEDVQFICLNPGSVYPTAMRTNKNVIIYLTRDGRCVHDSTVLTCSTFGMERRPFLILYKFWDYFLVL